MILYMHAEPETAEAYPDSTSRIFPRQIQKHKSVCDCTLLAMEANILTQTLSYSSLHFFTAQVAQNGWIWP